MKTMKWIETKEALLMILKYDKETADDYQRYLDNDPWSPIDWQEEEEEGNLMSFDNWYEVYKDDMDYTNSDEFVNLINRQN